MPLTDSLQRAIQKAEQLPTEDQDILGLTLLSYFRPDGQLKVLVAALGHPLVSGIILGLLGVVAFNQITRSNSLEDARREKGVTFLQDVSRDLNNTISDLHGYISYYGSNRTEQNAAEAGMSKDEENLRKNISALFKQRLSVELKSHSYLTTAEFDDRYEYLMAELERLTVAAIRSTRLNPKGLPFDRLSDEAKSDLDAIDKLVVRHLAELPHYEPGVRPATDLEKEIDTLLGLARDYTKLSKPYRNLAEWLRNTMIASSATLDFYLSRELGRSVRSPDAALRRPRPAATASEQPKTTPRGPGR